MITDVVGSCGVILGVQVDPFPEHHVPSCQVGD